MSFVPHVAFPFLPLVLLTCGAPPAQQSMWAPALRGSAPGTITIAGCREEALPLVPGEYTALVVAPDGGGAALVVFASAATRPMPLALDLELPAEPPASAILLLALPAPQPLLPSRCGQGEVAFRMPADPALLGVVAALWFVLPSTPGGCAAPAAAYLRAIGNVEGIEP